MSARAELLNVIARLEVISHVPAVNLDPTPAATDAAKGGGRPRGGIDRKDDREHDFALKSADHYRRRLAGAHSDRAVDAILRDARLTLTAWTHTPIRGGTDPQRGHPMFMRWLAQQEGRVEDISRKASVSRALVYKAREQYRQDAA